MKVRDFEGKGFEGRARKGARNSLTFFFFCFHLTFPDLDSENSGEFELNQKKKKRKEEKKKMRKK